MAASGSRIYGPEGNEDITMSDDYERRQEAEDDDMPPLKKRRGLAGSIVSTAVSAALIGTAVGLTVYRLWRDRGKDFQHQSSTNVDRSLDHEPISSPPPPYQQGEWRQLEQPPAVRVAPSAQGTPSTPRSAARHAKQRLHAAAAPKRAVVYARRARPKTQAQVSPPPIRPEFDFARTQEVVEEQTEVEDKRDWLGDKLSMLIEQGKKALNAEIVVMSDAKEDEVDDGSGAWEEDVGSGSTSKASSIRSTNKKRAARPKSIVPPPSGVGLGLYGVNASGSGSLSASPRRAGYGNGYTPSTSPAALTSTSYASASAGFAPSSSTSSLFFDTPRKTHMRGISHETALPPSSSFSAQDDPAGWESPELRESMERARARLLARRAGA
ncbi:hypothetical protein M413DRAFT_442730 [Hebeloma cylindrosporum]|uniref:Uncharacterized protein n=1 Tax=Hebeloma cylindrosporum TaxID=76867 RepID=A0A0C3C7D2_HEBCY|nr:hypothetical protein M413DRAFT_442730 [Hebeloma cylindrosporum h7]